MKLVKSFLESNPSKQEVLDEIFERRKLIRDNKDSLYPSVLGIELTQLIKYYHEKFHNREK